MQITQPILIGVVSGIAVTNCIFAVAWCIFKGRHDRYKRQRQLVLGRRSSALKQHPSRVSPKAAIKTADHSYMQGMYTVNQSKRGNAADSRARNSHAMLYQGNTQSTHPIVPPGLPLPSGSFTVPSEMCGASTFSDDASVYSSASAPPEFHECLLGAQILHPVSTPDNPDTGHLGLTRTWSDGARAPHIREGLTPEACPHGKTSDAHFTKLQFMSQAHIEPPNISTLQRSESMILAGQRSPSRLNQKFRRPHSAAGSDSHRRFVPDQQFRVLESPPPLQSPHSPPQYAMVTSSHHTSSTPPAWLLRKMISGQ